jgi:oligopeptide/dipeptide ABC transporter ATP-binding protein
MYLGKVAELAPKHRIFSFPTHPYTQALLTSIPGDNPYSRGERIPLRGDVPNPANPPTGRRFHTRCPIAEARCAQGEPPLREIEGGHWTACWLA